MNVTIPKVNVNDQTASLNDTVNTQAFGSPKSDIFTTSSPHSNESTETQDFNPTIQRDAKIINVSG